jgi:hypothetical protein
MHVVINDPDQWLQKHQPTKSDVLKAIELWEIIATNLSGKLTVLFCVIGAM